MATKKLIQTFQHLLLLICFLAFSTPAFSTNQQSPQNIPQANWHPCYEELGEFECTEVKVPLNYSKNNAGESYENWYGPQIPISMIRVPARDPSNKIGSLFLNPGGPGGSGINFVLGVGYFLYNDEVRDRFDIVGFDPRGIARSQGLSCFTSLAQLDELAQMPVYPIEHEDIFEQLAFDKKFRKNCRRNAGEIIDHMTTADVAKDLDILRQAVGDKQLNYAGFSYGSYLGITYANLFPDNFRALIIDAVIDPIAWSTGRKGEKHVPVFNRIRSHAGAAATLEEFFRLCDLASPQNCFFSGQSKQHFNTLAERLRSDPITLSDIENEVIVDKPRLISFTLALLYNSGNWADLSYILQVLESATNSELVSAEYSWLIEFITSVTRYANDLAPQSIEGYYGVLCSDSNNPRYPFTWPIAAEFAEYKFGVFGPRWTWASSPCARWPGSKKSRYIGPFNRETTNPVLVMSPLFDPATRYESAKFVDKLMPNSRLVTVEGWGHATLFMSQCATELASNYLVNGVVPENNSICRQDTPPFGLDPELAFNSPVFKKSKNRLSINGLRNTKTSAVQEQDNSEKRKRALRAIGHLHR